MSTSPLRVIVISSEHRSELPDIPVVARCQLSGDVSSSFRNLEPLSADSDFWTVDWRTNLLDTLKHHATDNHVGYVVPGHPMLGDASIQALVEFDSQGVIDLELYDEPLPVVLTELLSLSSGSPAFVDALTLIECSRSAPFDSGSVPLNSSQSTIITSISPARTGEFISDYASRWFRNSTKVRLIPMTGELEQIVLPLENVRDESSIHPHYLIIPPSSGDDYQRSMTDLQRIVARLRAPGGCPWDREQTNRSLSKGLIEESYELLDAIEREDRTAVREEMGDFLLQAFMHTQITHEHGSMRLEDVIQTLIDKLLRRHPHVFATDPADTSEAVIQTWDDIKRAERAARGQSDAFAPLGDIPASLPALLRLQSVLKRSGRTALSDLQIHDIADATTGEITDEHERTLVGKLVRIASEGREAGIDLEHAIRAWTSKYEQSVAETLAEPETAD